MFYDIYLVHRLTERLGVPMGGVGVESAAIDDEEFYTSVELEEYKEEERGKYELMKADFGSWDTKSGVTGQGPMGSALFSAILIFLASS